MDTVFFLFNRRTADSLRTIESVLDGGGIDRVVVFQSEDCTEDYSALTYINKVKVVRVAEVGFCGDTLRRINEEQARYKFLYLKSEPLEVGYRMTVRMKAAADAQSLRDGGSLLVYADHYEVKNHKTLTHPLTDWQRGSVRNDFDFGSVLLFVGKIKESPYRCAALYYAWLYTEEKIHIPELLYTEQESDLRLSGQKQFDYVNPAQREVQIEMEEAFTEWLGDENAKHGLAGCGHDADLRINSQMIMRANVDAAWENGVEATVIIPVRNREKTIGDAIRSALSQKTDFPFNIIVIDNHSTDATSSAIAQLAQQDERVIHLIPKREDLGIGGCWDMAIRDGHCGKFAVQLDSDDLYSSPQTLQKIINKFYETKAAMVIGAYELVDFKLNPLPPGLIDHKEWTDSNGMNNALRINGLGAPRAFFTPVARQIGFPNVSYGEDYAVGLAISRRYRIGRIYESLYLCRRWEGNSDAALSIEKTNRNNIYKDWIRTQELLSRAKMIEEGITSATAHALFLSQMEAWPEVAERFSELKTGVERKALQNDAEMALAAQFNPARIKSTNAKVDKKSISERRCFLCEDYQPAEQLHLNHHGRYQLCVNPYPILPLHFTMPSVAHQPQLLQGHYTDFADIVHLMPDYLVFYNGAHCGASAPDHFHFQLGEKGHTPLERNLDFLSMQSITDRIFLLTDYPCPTLVCHDIASVEQIVKALPIKEGEAEPRFNLLGWSLPQDDGALSPVYVVIPRHKHRPDCYYAEGEERLCISPGAIDMAGLLITPRKEDFKQLTSGKAHAILEEVGLQKEDLLPLIEKLRTIA